MQVNKLMSTTQHLYVDPKVMSVTITQYGDTVEGTVHLRTPSEQSPTLRGDAPIYKVEGTSKDVLYDLRTLVSNLRGLCSIAYNVSPRNVLGPTDQINIRRDRCGLMGGGTNLGVYIDTEESHQMVFQADNTACAAYSYFAHCGEDMGKLLKKMDIRI